MKLTYYNTESILGFDWVLLLMSSSNLSNHNESGHSVGTPTVLSLVNPEVSGHTRKT